VALFEVAVIAEVSMFSCEFMSLDAMTRSSWFEVDTMPSTGCGAKGFDQNSQQPD
jgi:hypothetical protein